MFKRISFKQFRQTHFNILYMCHGKLPVPITADLFAPILSVARADSPSYTNSTPSMMQFTSRLPGVVVCKHCCWEMSVNHVTMECPVGG